MAMDSCGNSVPKNGFGGFSGNPSAQRPERSWEGAGGQGRDEDNPPVSKAIKIPGGGSRPF